MDTSSALTVVKALFTGIGKVELKAGAAEAVITPKIVLKSLADVNWIGEVGDGYYTPKEGELIPVYGDLYARALVLEDGWQSLAIVTLDMTSISYDRTETLLESINRATGIPKENIVINCSHTHNEPDESDPNIKEAPSFEAELADYLATIVKNAVDNLQAATVRVGREPVQIAYNRRLMGGDGEITMAPLCLGWMCWAHTARTESASACCSPTRRTRSSLWISTTRLATFTRLLDRIIPDLLSGICAACWVAMEKRAESSCLLRGVAPISTVFRYAVDSARAMPPDCRLPLR